MKDFMQVQIDASERLYKMMVEDHKERVRDMAIWADTSVKPAGVRSNNTGKASGKSTGAAVRAAAAKGKSKSKAVPKG